MKQHITTGLKVIWSTYIKSDKVYVTYEDMSMETMTHAEFKQMHKDVES